MVALLSREKRGPARDLIIEDIADAGIFCLFVCCLFVCFLAFFSSTILIDRGNIFFLE